MAKKPSASTAAPASQVAKAPKSASKTSPVAVGERIKPATPPSVPSRQLDVFPNPAPERDYLNYQNTL